MVEEGKRALREIKTRKPVQLPLFTITEKDTDYSNTIELYDAIPKYYRGKAALKRKDGQWLQSLKRTFEHRGVKYRVAIIPGRIEGKDGVEKDYYPGRREELLEDALRKLACDGQGVFVNNKAGVVFSLYELRKELKKVGHTYSLQEIKEAFLVCNRSTMELNSDSDDKIILNGHIFEVVGLRDWEDWKGAGQKTKCFVQFNWLVTQSINNRTFRQVNYKQCMEYKEDLARWLHKRMSHNYRQASMLHPYSIKLSTIIRDSGMKPYKRLRDNLRKTKKALDEMASHRTISRYEEERRVDPKTRKILDVKFTLTPGINFVSEMKKANAKFSEIQKLKQPGAVRK